MSCTALQTEIAVVSVNGEPTLIQVNRKKPGEAVWTVLDPTKDAEWTDTAPTKPGRYLWRKDRKWEPVYRDLVLRADGRLYTYSERFLNWVPLSHIEAGGSQWHISTR